MRKNYCVIAYSEKENRGIAFPKGEHVKPEEFFKELKEIAENPKEIKEKAMIVVLVFKTKMYCKPTPMSEFLKDKKGSQVLANDNMVRELYEFYFARAKLQVGPNGISYTFCG